MSARMDDRHRVNGFDVNGFLANSKTNLISLLQPYQAPANLGTTSKNLQKKGAVNSPFESDEDDDDEDDEFDEDEPFTDKTDTGMSSSRVQHEIGRIYERRNYSGDYKSLGLHTTPSNGMESTSSKDAVISRAYVRPTKPSVSAPAPVSSQLEAMEHHLAPPLPLLRFSATDEAEVASANTITGEKIRTIPNLIGPSPQKESVPLCDPMYTRKIAKWFVKRSFKESNLRQVESYSNHFGCSTAGAAAITDEYGCKPEVLEHTVYESLLYAEVLADRRARDAARIPEEQLFQERYDRILLAQTVAGASPSITTNSSYKDLASLPLTTAPVLNNNNATINTPPPSFTPSLQFDGEFECGNLEKAVRVIGRETLLPSGSLEQVRDSTCPGEVDQEYDLTLRKDSNTDGNIQWYYFAVTTPAFETDMTERNMSGSGDSSSRPTPLNSSRGGASALAPLSVPLNSRAATHLGGQYGGLSGRNTPAPGASSSALAPVKYPLRVRFNIINMQKKDSLYNYGMMPCTYSVNQRDNEDWLHRGEDVCYYRNGHTTVKAHKKSDKKVRLQYHYTLTFTYTFEGPDVVYFAHTFPYTYSDLQLSLCKMEQKYRNSGFFHQRKLCETLAGNSCDILSISERSAGIIESKNKPAIVLTSRVHPGESNSSFMIQGFLDFITSELPEAVKLRQSFVFHIIPMLNPDGVIHGNYRCSLAATDLNRRYGAPHPKLHPTILAKKNFLKSTAQNRSILLYLDLHGHSKLKNAFCYGCDVTLQNDKIARQMLPHMSPEDVTQRRVFSRVFPRVLGAVSSCSQDGYFSYRDCSYHVNKSKGGTGRVVCWREINIAASYTIEASFCGNGDNKESALFKKATESNNSATVPVPITAKPSTAPANSARRSSSTPVLPRFRQDGNATAGLPPTSGIAYFAAASDISGIAGSSKLLPNVMNNGTEVDSDGDALFGGNGATESPLSRNNKRKVYQGSKKEKTRPMSHRKSSVAAAAPPTLSTKKGASAKLVQNEMREQSSTPVGDIDKALNDLLDRYHRYVHYRKEDLLKMGRDIGMAIYHFANLSHSSIEEELKIATKADAEAKAKAKELERINNQQEAAAHNAQKSSSSTLSSKLRKPSFVPRADRSQYSNSLETRRFAEQEETGNNGDVHLGHLQSAAWCLEGGSGSGYEERLDQDPGIDVTNGDYDGLDCALPSAAYFEDGQDGAEGALDNNMEEVELDLEGDDSEHEEEREGEEEVSCDSGSRSGAPGPGGRKSSPPKGGAVDVTALVQEYTSTKVRLMEYDMVQRSLLKAGVFSSTALETAMQTYPSEFLTEQVSTNIGMRMKCEYNIRRGLRCTEGIRLTEEMLRQHDASLTQPIEEDNMSTDGSDSNPSVDNVPATKMLKNIKKFKSNVGLVLALRKAAIRKKKKDLETDRKLKKKAARKLARQASDEKRAQDEAKALQSAKETRDVAALAALQQATATATAQQIAENLKEKVSRRKSSIFHSAPKHAPLYRYAPDEIKMSAQPLPMKVVNFRDYDSPEDGGPPPSRSRKGSESNFESQPQPPSLPPQQSAHALALSMSTLTNAVNKLYFNAAEEPTPQLPTRRHASHTNSASTPNLPSVAHSSTADPPVPLPLFTATSLRRDPVPSRAAPPTLPVQPTLHNMSSLVPVGPAEPLLRVRERPAEESYGMRSFVSVSDAPPLVGRVRPKSGSATSANRRRIN